MRLSISGFVLALPQVAVAGSEIHTSIDGTATGGYSNNPYGQTGSGTGSTYADLRAAPDIRWVSEYNTISLGGNADYKHYFRNYSDSVDYSATLDYLGRPSSRLNTHANLRYDSAIIGGVQAITSSSGQTSLPTTGPDLSLYGSRARRRSLDGAADISYSLSARDTLTANAYYDTVRYRGFGSSNYHAYGGGAGYSRRLSEHLQFGAQASASRYVYQGLLGKSQVYTLQATLKADLNDYWKLSGALGASHADRSVGGATTTPTGNLLLCRTGPRASLCAFAAESVLPTGVSGTVTTTTAGGNYTYTLSERSTVSLSANYAHNGEPAGPGRAVAAIVGNSTAQVTANYNRTLRERVHFVANANYRKIYGGTAGRPEDFGGSVGISVQLGDYR